MPRGKCYKGPQYARAAFVDQSGKSPIYSGSRRRPGFGCGAKNARITLLLPAPSSMIRWKSRDLKPQAQTIDPDQCRTNCICKPSPLSMEACMRKMLSPSNLSIGIYLASAIVLGSVVDAAAKNFPSMLAQMTPSVCWEGCSAPCSEAYKKCAADAKLDPDQLTACRRVEDACRDQCRDQCGIKK